MNTLEKILKEIEEATFQEDAFIYAGDMEVDRYVRESVVKDIIRSHMDGISKTTDVQEVEGIDVDNAIRILKDMQSPKIDYAEMVGAPAFCYGKRYVFQDPEDYAIETALVALNEKKERDARRVKDTNVSVNDGWIPVSERLPEEHESIFAKFKGTDKWSNAMFEKASDDVNITYEFEDGTRKTATSYTIDGEWKLERRITKRKVIAWQPLPTPYKGELNPKDISHTCDTCRRYGKSDHNCYYCKFKPRQDLWEPKEEAHE